MGLDGAEVRLDEFRGGHLAAAQGVAGGGEAEAERVHSTTFGTPK